MIGVYVSNAHVLHTKSQNHVSLRALQFRKELVSALVQGKCFRREINSWLMCEHSFVLVRHITGDCITHKETTCIFCIFYYFFNFYFTKGNH